MYLGPHLRIPPGDPWGLRSKRFGVAAASLARRRSDALDRSVQHPETSARNHHYVPQAYMRKWSSDQKRVLVLDTSTGLDRMVGIRHLCSENDFYRVTGPDGREHNRVEMFFGVLDGEMARVQRLLCDMTSVDEIQRDDFASLTLVMAMQRNRTAQSRRVESARRAWSAVQPHAPGGTPSGPDSVELTTEFMRYAFDGMYAAADVLATRQLEIWSDPKGRFVTSDAPVMVPFESGSRRDLVETARLYWPVSPHRMVVLSTDHAGKRVVERTANARQVDEFIGAAIQGRERFLLATPSSIDLLPRGKILRRRAQLEVRCTPLGGLAGNCIVDSGAAYADAPVVVLCPRHVTVEGLAEFR
ncbi:DUF4238 domain-containing protein [Cellulosimicrobium cellulans]|uniref:DUF4238 domain-containing protein n=1 Tax=Cellulosimicrobium cellulans TaxID=1710 RepID=UPI002406BC13|nr:DUF4238 domain-containing protein [Cellulosimicrobium cellulans]